MIAQLQTGSGSRRRFALRFALSLCAVLLAASAHAAERWTPTGPLGGDARAFAAVPGQPRHLFLGTTNSWIYESLDGGSSWSRLAKLDDVDDLIVDSLVVDEADPQTVFAAAWRLNATDGGLWISHDSGHTFKEAFGLHSQSIRALAQAPSNAKILFAGSLDGVFRTADRGLTWERITPKGSAELHEFESLAVDPQDPRTVYAGTWHLPWKTTDGGKSWANIKDGVIDDSDVFSILVDPVETQTVYASACSGIYKSETGGAHFRKVQGIPSTARRTRVLVQDPKRREVVYAGTTEGLYRTEDSGKNFHLLTDPGVVVNDVFVDPANTNHVLLATDRIGVLVTNDGGQSFATANLGFSARKVEAVLADQKDPQKLYAGVLNDKNQGGAFLSTNGGQNWRQISDGLDGRDVFVLAQASDGALVAGTNHGILAFDAQTAHWEPRNHYILPHRPQPHVVAKPRNGKPSAKPAEAAEPVPAADGSLELQGRILALDVSTNVWLAATQSGLLTSRDRGLTWRGGEVMGASDYRAVSVLGPKMAAARMGGVVLSLDAGLNWEPLALPTMIQQVHTLAFDASGTLWLASREGLFFTRDLGKTWLWVDRLPLTDIDAIFCDTATNRVLVSSRASDLLFSIEPKSLDWSYYKTGYRLAQVRRLDGCLVAASLFDGVLLAGK